MLLLGYLGDLELAGGSLAIAFANITGYSVLSGFAVSTRVGNELGANRAYKAKLSAVVSIFMAAVMGFSAVVFATAMRHRWGRMFTGDEDILSLTAVVLPILGLCELGNCPQTVACGVVRGTLRPSVAVNVNLSAFYLVGMPVAVGLGFLGFGWAWVFGLWLGWLLAQVCCAGLMLCVIGTTDWDFEARRAQQMMLANESNGDVGIMDGQEKQLTNVVTLTS
ncbi:hypothetical protein TanjilG_02942 [Lupinus angustifolius]|uniref:Protein DETOXIFICATION n=1 Tax=Lupinus angustifolius TaxID=3871 RepID=A0A1J7FZ40_LUPAN|nr:hypothetical protein TanjilG_02942 [Lupinus angustifolius]